MKNSLSASQLAEYLQVSKRTIQRRSNNEHWPFVEHVGLGGARKMYTFVSLPADIKHRVISNIIVKHEQQGFAFNNTTSFQKDLSALNSPFIVSTKSTECHWLAKHIFAKQSCQAFDESELNKEFIKVGLLVLAQLFVAHKAIGKIKGFDELAKRYNTRQLDLHDPIYATISSISRISLLRWAKQFKENGTCYQIVDSSDVQALLDKDLYLMAKELLMTSPNLTAKRLKQYFVTIFPDRKTPSSKQLSQWLKQQKTQESPNV